MACFGRVHGLRGSLACPDPVSAGLGDIRFPGPLAITTLLPPILLSYFDLALCICCSTSATTSICYPHLHNSALHLVAISHFPLRPSTMDQPPSPNEPNAAAMHDARRRRGSVGTTQLLDNIVSTSNCTFSTVG